jgi:glycosyltransferase involved in cell wall biosynthesis
MPTFLFYDDKIINILLKEEKPSGGAAVQAYGWIKGLLEWGQRIVVMTNPCRVELLKDECRQIILAPLYNRKKGVRWIRWVYYRLPFIYKQIKQARPDYLYQGIPGWTSYFLGLICKQLKIKYILRISNDFLLDERFYKKYGKAHRIFQWKGLKSAYLILCQNDYQLNIIKREFPGTLVAKMPNPIAINKTVLAVDAHLKKYIAWLGLYQYQKNLKLLFEIASVLKEEQFHIAGKEEESCDEDTRFYLKKLQELPNVKFIGFLNREQVLPFLANARFLLNTSHYEGFSNTFLEAMSVGTPIISSEKVNPDEIITQFGLGIIYSDPYDLLVQYSAITPDAYKAMSKNVSSYVFEQHDYKRLSRRLIDFLNAN